MSDRHAFKPARPIDRAYAEINALGGYVSPDDREGAARMAMLEAVLAILESHGAVDSALAVRTPEPAREAA